MRWKIETFHIILRSGCKAEEFRLSTADRLTNLIAVFCILSWRIFWITMLGRSTPRAAAKLAFTRTEIDALEHVVHDTPLTRRHHRSCATSSGSPSSVVTLRVAATLCRVIS